MSKKAKIVELRQQGMLTCEIAAAVGVSDTHVSRILIKCGMRTRDRLPNGQRRFSPYEYMQSKAKERGTTVPKLKARLMAAIAKDDMINAILDE